MPIWLKVLLVTLAVLVVAVVGGGLGFKFWLEANRARLKSLGERARNEGTAFGRKSDAGGCVAEGLARLGAKRGFVEQVVGKMFVKACLAVATRPTGFCTGVPKPDEVLSTTRWSLAECKRRNHDGDQFCFAMIAAIGEACWPDATSSRSRR